MLWNAETLTGEISAIRAYNGKSQSKERMGFTGLECLKQIQTAFFFGLLYEDFECFLKAGKL